MKFSILVVCLNAGEKLLLTVNSILEQTFTDYEIVVKDGGSTDGSLDALPDAKAIRVIREKDQGIYDAMNQAARVALGEYVYFLNCGDYFYDKEVLQNINKALEDQENGKEADIIYGNIYDMITESTVFSNPAMNAFGCYRNVPCHQACFYKKELVLEHPFSTKYKVRADYEQFLWCFFKAGAKLSYTPVQIASYEGGGFSESKKNIKKSAQEHKEITRMYMSKTQLFMYKAIMILTLSKVRTFMSHNPVLGRVYNGLKRCIYK